MIGTGSLNIIQFTTYVLGSCSVFRCSLTMADSLEFLALQKTSAENRDPTSRKENRQPPGPLPALAKKDGRILA